MNVRCEICLLNDGWARPNENIVLATVGGKARFVCHQHMPKPFEVQENESNSVSH